MTSFLGKDPRTRIPSLDSMEKPEDNLVDLKDIIEKHIKRPKFRKAYEEELKRLGVDTKPKEDRISPNAVRDEDAVPMPSPAVPKTITSALEEEGTRAWNLAHDMGAPIPRLPAVQEEPQFYGCPYCKEPHAHGHYIPEHMLPTSPAVQEIEILDLDTRMHPFTALQAKLNEVIKALNKLSKE